jgi:hypothetical protein
MSRSCAQAADPSPPRADHAATGRDRPGPTAGALPTDDL